MMLIQWLAKQKDGTEWELKKYSRKRTLTQNDYYWQLIVKMADVLRMPKEKVHNMMLRSYGQVQGIDGRLMTVTIPDTDKAWEEAIRSTTYHVKPTSQVKLGTKNQMFRTYILLKGSHEMTKDEMSILIDGTVHEAQQIGVETLTPQELEAMRNAEHHQRK